MCLWTKASVPVPTDGQSQQIGLLKKLRSANGNSKEVDSSVQITQSHPRDTEDHPKKL